MLERKHSTNWRLETNALLVDIECMAGNCNIILTEDMVLDLISSPHIREKYQRFAYQAYVNVSCVLLL